MTVGVVIFFKTESFPVKQQMFSIVLKLEWLKQLQQSRSYAYMSNRLTVATARSSLKYKSIWYGPISAQIRKVPVAHDDGGGVSDES